MAWLADAFPARDGADAGPLPRRARRLMQQGHRAKPPAPRGADGSAPPAESYGYGLVVTHDPRWGDVVGHSGGYPGFGSHMRWQVEHGIGVVVLANGRYAPCRTAAERALPILLEDAGAAPGRAAPWPETLRAKACVDRLLRGWDDEVARGLFADNVALDLDLGHRRRAVESLVARVGPLGAPGAGDRIMGGETPAHLAWMVPGAHGALRCEIRMTPQDPPLVETLEVTPAEDPDRPS